MKPDKQIRLNRIIVESLADQNQQLKLIIRCCLRAFQKHLNTVETRTIKRAAKRLGIKV